MSLKIVHIFVISLSICLALFFGVWAVNDHAVSKNTLILVMGVVSLAVGVSLIGYLAWFIIKMKKAKIQ